MIVAICVVVLVSIPEGALVMPHFVGPFLPKEEPDRKLTLKFLP